jgi:hypothetical protein
MGTKPTGLLSSALLAAIFVISMAVQAQFSKNKLIPRFSARILSVPFLGLLGLAFYLRNAVQFGNPIFPVQLQLAGIELPAIVRFDTFVEDYGGPEPVGHFLSFFQGLTAGAFSGPEKTDYDPRSGGFGLTVWLVILFVVLALVSWRNVQNLTIRRNLCLTSSALILTALILIVFQPRPDDTRYVISPFILLLMAGAIWSQYWNIPYRKWSAAAMVSVLSMNIISTETRFVGGLGSVALGLTFSQQYQASTPGNPRGVGLDYTWMPQGSAQRIFVESEGGLGSSGMIESSKIMQQSYALYGHCLCNEITFSDGRLSEKAVDGLVSAASSFDFILLLSDTASSFSEELKEHREVQQIAPIDGRFPIGYLVLARR